MNICFFNSNIAWGGGEKWHYNMAIEIQSENFNPILYAHPKSELYTRAKQNGIKVFGCRVSNLSFLNPVKIIWLAYQLKKKKIDVVVINLSSDVKFAGIAAKIAGIKKIIYRRGLAVAVKNSFINRFIFRKILDYVIVNSKDIGKKLFEKNSRLFNKKKLKIIYNGVKLEDYNNYKVEPKNTIPIILNVGRMVEQKGQKYLIDLASILHKNSIDCKIEIAGSGKLLNDLKTQIQKLNVENRIDFIGFQQDIKPWLAQSDLFILPSLHEGSANIIIEAMAMAKPVIAFNVSSMPEMIINGKNGYLIEFENIEMMAEKVIDLLVNKEKRIKFGLAGRKIVEDKFTYNGMKQKFTDLILNNESEKNKE